MRILPIAAAFFCVAKFRSEGLSCKNGDGTEVEWSIIYKLPHRLSVPPSTSLSSVPKKRGHDGSDYGYIDSLGIALGETNFTGGQMGIFSKEGNPLAKSLEPIFEWPKKKADQELVYIAYNDQPPEDEKQSSNWSGGHTKGLVLFNETSGLWLLHSVPKFPEKMFSGFYSFPKNAYVNGQTLLCMTFGIRALNTIAAHLLNQKPHIYKANAPDTIKEKVPNLALLLSNSSTYNVTRKVTKSALLGINGMPFLAFAKSGLLDDDVYSKSIAPALGTDLYVSSWQNGEGGKLDSECSLRYEVLDVESVSFPINGSKVSWLTKHDHAKWAVGRNSSKWLCIGSINRMRSQFKRGGETVCLAEEALGKLFQNAVTNHTTCSDDQVTTEKV